MTKPRKAARALRDHEVAIIRLVAKGLGNEQIAEELGLSTVKVEGRLGTVYALLGVKSTTGKPDALSRVRLTSWAYENGLMNSDDAPAVPIIATPWQPPAAPEPGPGMPEPLMTAVIGMCEAIVADRPRGDLRRIAVDVLCEAGRRRRPNQHRAKPTPPA